MDPLSIGIIGSSLISGIGNWLSNSSANDRATALQNEALQRFLAINIPDPEQQKVVMQRFVQQGQLDPALQQAIAQAPSEFQNIITNVQDSAAQSRALGELSKIGNEGGLRLQDKAALEDARMDSITREKSNRMGIADEMSRRGLSGSGYDVAARLSGQSDIADRESSAGLKVASDAQDRALQAIMGAGTLATGLRSQDFGEKSQKAASADRINAFNTANLRDINASNTGILNQAQATNLGERQRISDSNADLTNKESLYNTGLQQQKFDNEFKKAAGASGQYAQLANAAQTGGQLTGNAISNIGGAVTGALGDQQNRDYYSSVLDKYLKSKKSANSSAGSGY